MPKPIIKRGRTPHPLEGSFSNKPRATRIQCPVCGTEMIQVGLAQLSGDKVFVALECPNCHYRTQQRR